MSKLRSIAAVKVRFRGSRIISALGRKRAMLVPPNVQGNRRADEMHAEDQAVCRRVRLTEWKGLPLLESAWKGLPLLESASKCQD